MEKKVVRLGVVGMIRGKTVLEDFLGERGVVLRAVADTDEARLLRAVRDFTAMGVEDLRAYASLEALLADEEVDAVYIATDKPYHTRHAIMALEAGKHVLSEIPTVASPEEAAALLRAVKAHPQLKYMAAENALYFPFVDEWRRIIMSGELGEIVYAEGEYLHAVGPHTPPRDRSHWRVTMDAIEYLTHSLGPILSLLDDRCVSVTAMAPDENKQNPWRVGKELGAALFRTEKGRVIRILICFGACVGFAHNYRVLGTRGSLATDFAQSFSQAQSYARFLSRPETVDTPAVLPVGTAHDGSRSGHGGCDRRMLHAFLRCILEDTPSPVDAETGIRLSLPGVIAREAARTGKTLPIPDERSLL